MTEDTAFKLKHQEEEERAVGETRDTINVNVTGTLGMNKHLTLAVWGKPCCKGGLFYPEVQL